MSVAKPNTGAAVPRAKPGAKVTETKPTKPRAKVVRIVSARDFVKAQRAKTPRARPGLIPAHIPTGYQADEGPHMKRFYARDLAAARCPVSGVLDFKYMIEVTDMVEVIQTTLARIYNRDGAEVFEEVSKLLRSECLGSIAATRKHKGWKWKHAGRGVRRPVVPSIAA